MQQPSRKETEAKKKTYPFDLVGVSQTLKYHFEQGAFKTSIVLKTRHQVQVLWAV